MVICRYYQPKQITIMNIEARKQYMETLREKYLRANKKEKGRILDEYCNNTKQERKYVIFVDIRGQHAF